MKKFFNYLVCLLGFCFIVWLAVSWIDTNEHNDPFSEDYKNYSQWNAFEVIRNLKEDVSK
jgi:hypothetical protein